MTDLFSKGCLVVLETSAWTARCKVSTKSLLKGGNHADVDPNYVNASKKLIDGKALTAVESIRSEARQWLYSRSLPFPVQGAVFVPTDQVEAIDTKLAEFAERYQAAVDAFVAEYPALRQAARFQLGSLYSDLDYPNKVANRFAFDWRFLSLSPASEAQLVSPELVAKERAKFQRLMAEAAEAAVTELRTRFAACVDHMVDRLVGEDGKPKIFRDSLVENMKEFLSGFDTLNICNDQALADLVAKAREAVEGVDADDLRKVDATREHVSQRMAEVQKALDGMLVDKPSRKLRLTPAA